MILYIAGPYSGNIDANIAAARKVAIELWEAGHAVFCPHLNTIHFERDCKLSYEGYIQGDLKILERMDAIVMLPNWEQSNGAIVEHQMADHLQLLIYYYPCDIPKDISEIAIRPATT